MMPKPIRSLAAIGAAAFSDLVETIEPTAAAAIAVLVDDKKSRRDVDFEQSMVFLLMQPEARGRESSLPTILRKLFGQVVI